jgi:RNA polymerase I-specific transcription initiation factor RRN3
MITLSSTLRSPTNRALDATATVKPILVKSSSVLGTRTRDDSESEPVSPVKRRKTVSIDETLNEVRNISKSLDDMKRDVRRALELRASGDNEDYDLLKEAFDADWSSVGSQPNRDTNSQDLLAYILALTSHVPMLGRSCSSLIESILKWYVAQLSPTIDFLGWQPGHVLSFLGTAVSG